MKATARSFPVLLASALSCAVLAQPYDAVVLPHLVAGGQSCALDVNYRGQTAGWSVSSSGVIHAAMWPLGQAPVDLNGLAADQVSDAWAISDSGWIAGRARSSTGVERAVVWRPGSAAAIELGALPGGSSGRALAVNFLGQAAGTSSSFAGDRAFRWSAQTGRMEDLGVLPGAFSSEGRAINSSGWVAGWCGTPQGLRAFLWRPGKGMQDLGVLPGAVQSYAQGINDMGWVVGVSPVDGAAHSFLWKPETGVMEDLGVLPSASSTYAADINAGGITSGGCPTASGMKAWVKTGSMAMVDLGALLGDPITEGRGVSVTGWVSGYASRDGLSRAVLWKPRLQQSFRVSVMSGDGAAGRPNAGWRAIGPIGDVVASGSTGADGGSPAVLRQGQWTLLASVERDFSPSSPLCASVVVNVDAEGVHGPGSLRLGDLDASVTVGGAPAGSGEAFLGSVSRPVTQGRTGRWAVRLDQASPATMRVMLNGRTKSFRVPIMPGRSRQTVRLEWNSGF